ncbi:MAG: G8 domain-containing protein, partial [Bacteroidota bacterium]
MIKLVRIAKKLLLTVAFILLGCQVYSATRTASVSGNWNSTSTWGNLSVPVSGDDVIINSGITVTMNSNPGSCNNITIYGTLNLQNSRTLNVNGSLVISGGTLIGSGTGPSTGTLNVAGSFSVPSSTDADIQRLTLTISGTTNVSGTLSFSISTTGTKTFNGLVTVNSGGIWDNSINEDIFFEGGISNSGTFTAGTGNYTFNTNNQSITGTLSIPTITVTGITLTNNGILTVALALEGSGGLTQGSSASLDLDGTSGISTLTASLSGNTVDFSGVAQTVNPTTYFNLTLSGSGTLTTSGVTVNGRLSMENTASASNTPTYGTNASLQYNTSIARLAGVEWISTFAATGGVIIANTGTISLNAAKIFNPSVPLTINSGASLASANFQISFGGDFINNGGTFSAGSSAIVILNTMAIQSIAGFSTTGPVSMTKTTGTATFLGNVSGAGLTLNGTGGTLNLGSSLTHTFTGAVTLTAGALAGGSGTLLNLAGNWAKNAGLFTAGSGTIRFNGSLAQTLGGTASTTFNNLTISNTAGVSLANNEIIGGILNLNSGLVTTGIYSLSVTNTSAAAITGGSTTNFINGPLSWSLTSGQSYTFPLGKGTTYLPFDINSVSGTSPQVKVEAFTANAGGTPASPLVSLSTSEYWQASVVSGTYSGGSVSLTRQAALNELESIGRNTTSLSGSYSTLNGTVSGTAILNSTNTGSALGYFLMASRLSITTGSITPTSYCPGSAVSVPFTITGPFTSGNVFTAQLSDASGSFTSPTTIGTLTSVTAGTIGAVIPTGQSVGSGYRIRVVSNTPLVIGSNNGTDIVLAVPTIIATYPGSQCGSGAVTLTAVASIGTINWYAALSGGSSLGTGPTFVTPSLSTSTTYYADATLGGCTSSPRAAVLASVITPPTISAGGGGTFCSGSTITLTSTGTNLTDQYWTGPNGFYSLDPNPVVTTNATAAMTGTYTVTGSALSGINMVTNGDFELGNVGFTSSYTNSTDLYPEGTYAVVADPSTVHPNFINCSDHSPSGTLQLVVNGATIAGEDVWSQTVNVSPGTDYQFTYWVQSVVASNPSQLQLYVNGVAAGPVYTALTPTCQWAQFIYNWNSGPSTTAILALENQNIVASGNDFALDDIIFQPVCAATSTGKSVSQPKAPTSSSVYVTVNAVVTAGAIGTSQSICRGFTPAALTSITAGTGSGIITYEWQTNASGSFVTITGANAATYSPPALTATTGYQRRTVSVSGGITCYSPYTTAVIITVSGPTSVPGGPNTVCQSATPLAIALSGASVGGGATTGAWSIISGGGSLSSTAQTGTPATVTYTPAANYSGTVTLRLTTNVVGTCT